MDRATLNIEGMTCDHCVRAVSRALSGVAGVTVGRVEIGTAEVSYDGSQTTAEAMAAAIEEEGYEVRSIGRES